MTDLAIRRLLSSGVGSSDDPVAVDHDDSTALDRGVGQTPAWRSPRALRLLSLTPFVVPLAELLLVRGYVPALTATPPAIVGAPLALALELALLGWAALGAALVWRVRSARLAQIALFVFAPTAIAGLVFRPAVIELMQHLAV